MNERRQDFDLLQRFTRDGEQSAFANLVRRHLDLVFGTALRKLEDQGAAQEVAQNVFTVLARKAWQFAPDDSLPAWLHKSALLESKSWLRGELRRRRREQAAAELGTTMNPPDDQAAFNALVPLLDDALLSLREKDRTALLLRFYENHSLREVGAAFGVSEDTAQKRVQGALEKLAEFFKRRGFKTATVGAAAAALQHTAASASAAMVGTVVGAALKVAPPALVGLGALLAWLASMSRVQTAAVCVMLAAMPVAWQMNERHAAGEEAMRTRTQLLAEQKRGGNAQAELEQLRASAADLEQTVTEANEVAARAAKAAQAFEAWKKKTRSQLMAADYRWDDDSPFARIPKAVLPELSELTYNTPFSPPGVVNPYARELMCLTSTERQALEDALQRVTELQRGEKAEVYEMNGSAGGRVVASKTFTDEPPGKAGEESEQRFSQMLANLHSVLGDERWLVLPSRLRSPNCDVWNRALIPTPTTTIAVSVDVNDQGIPEARWTYTGDMAWAGVIPPAQPGNAKAGNVYSVNLVGWRNGSAPLSTFLPEGDPNQTKNSTDLGKLPGPEPFRQRAAAWFQEQAAARLGKGGKP